MSVIRPNQAVRKLFAGLTEQTFIEKLGLADPKLTDYLSTLLSRFLHMESVYRLRNGKGERIAEVADMVKEAEDLPPEGRTRREVHRHIGDFTLFWTGIFPEAVKKLRSSLSKDYFVDYCEQGKRSYYIASTFEDDQFQEEVPVLRRLSEEFELCAFGLNEVRKEWERNDNVSS